MTRFLPFTLLIHLFFSAYSQNSLPATYLFDKPPTAIFAQTIHNDTIVCVGSVFKEGDTIHYQQGAFIAFIDSCGNLISLKKYFDAQGRDIFLNISNKIIRTNDGGYCFIGSVGSEKMMLKTDFMGDTVFIQTYSIPDEFDYASFMSIHEINDCLYVIGFGGTQLPFEDDLFMFKFDHNGNQVNYWRFPTPENCEYFQDAIVEGNNIVISVAQTNACVSGILKSKTRIFEVDTSGNILWDWVDNNSNLKRGGGLGLKSTPDGGWIYAGAYNDTFYSAIQFDRLFVTKIDSNRNHEWTDIIGYRDNGYNFFKDIAIDTEGNYIIAGQYRIGHPDFPSLSPAICAIVTKISPSGEILWTNISKAFESGPDTGMVMLTTNVNLLSSGNIMIGGYLYRTINQVPQNEGWLAKLSPSGEVLDDPAPFCGFVSVLQPESEPTGNILCYPNPAGDFVQFDLSRLPAEMRCGQLTIYDLIGKIIAEKHIEAITENIIVDTRNVPDGIYLYRIACGQNPIHSGRFFVKKS